MRVLWIVLIVLFSSGCAMLDRNPPMPTVSYVNLERFMGDWYVIANIPTFIEKQAHNAVESYELNEDGTIATTFTFNKGSFSGPEKKYTPKGFVLDKSSNALWGMRFIWPFKADYRIVYLSEDYTQTIIARRARDYVWLMAKTPSIEENDYQHLISVVNELGYETQKIQKVPQQK